MHCLCCVNFAAAFSIQSRDDEFAAEWDSQLQE